MKNMLSVEKTRKLKINGIFPENGKPFHTRILEYRDSIKVFPQRILFLDGEEYHMYIGKSGNVGGELYSCVYLYIQGDTKNVVTIFIPSVHIENGEFFYTTSIIERRKLKLQKLKEKIKKLDN